MKIVDGEIILLITELKKSIILSIKPKYALQIYKGEKTFELRKVFAKRNIKYVFLIETDGIKKLTGYFEIDNVIRGNVKDNWKLLESRGYNKNHYYNYFEQRENGFVILLRKPKRFNNPIDLRSLVDADSSFTIPQTFIYLENKPNIRNLILNHILDPSHKRKDFELRAIHSTDYPLFRKLVIKHIGRYYDDIDDTFADKLINCTEAGSDEFGYFTRSKSVYAIYFKGKKVGFTTLTYKKGNSLKTGPTILLDKFRGQGIGCQFRGFIDSFLQMEGIRKIYCTCPDISTQTISYLIKSDYRIEAHAPSQYSMKSGEFIFGKMLTNTSSRNIKIDRSHRALTSIRINRLTENIFNKYFRSSFSKYYFKIDHNFGRIIVSALSDLRGDDIFYKKQKLVYVGYENKLPHSLVVLSPKRGGSYKITLAIRNSNIDANRKLFSMIENDMRTMGARKLFVSFPVQDEEMYILFKSFNYVSEGVLREPYQDGIDFLQLSKSI